jgi:hypothetical protein
MFRIRALIALALVIVIAASCSETTSGKGDRGSSPPTGPITPSPRADESPSPRPDTSGPAATIELTNLTFGHAEATPLVTTEPIDPRPGTLVLAHVMAFRPGGPTAPTLSGNGLTWTLVGGNLEGEKRHWVFRGVGADPAPGPTTIDWAGAPTETLWVIDAASGTALGDDGAEAIVQFVSQESQRNADAGAVGLEPFADPENNATVCFALAGSGAASDISPIDGFVETAEADNPGQNLIISDFWKRGDAATCAADFLHESGTKQIESWLFLAVELQAARA